MKTQNLEKIEAIYINPKWRSSKVGEFMTKPEKPKSQGDLKSSQKSG
jgi:hypothetical protein